MIDKYLAVFISILLAVQASTLEPTSVEQRPCQVWESVVFDNSTETFSNGSVLFNDIMFPRDQIYQISNKNETETRGCVCSLKICLRKCCEVGSSLSAAGCRPSPKSFVPEMLKYYVHNDRGEIRPANVTDMTKYLAVRNPIKINCKGGFVVTYETKFDKFYVFENGTVLITTAGTKNKIEDYCLEWKDKTEKVAVIACIKRSDKKEEEEKTQITSDYLVVGMIVSIPFLVVTFLVYCATNEVQNIFGKSLLCQVASLAVSYGAVLMNYFKPDIIFLNLGIKNLCTVFGYISHFGMLANISWLTVMCFDIFLVFSGFSISYRSLTKEEEFRRFIKYSYYAWGVPFLICIGIFVTDKKLYNEMAKKEKSSYCMMHWEYSWALFYISVLMLSLLANILFFSATAFNIYQHKKGIKKVLNSNENNCSNPVEKKRLKLYFKLFLVMGIPWIFEPVSLVFDNKPRWFWMIFDLINSLHGVTIFAIFVCTRRMIQALSKTFCPSNHFFVSERLTTMTSPSTNSSGSASFHKKNEKQNQ